MWYCRTFAEKSHVSVRSCSSNLCGSRVNCISFLLLKDMPHFVYPLSKDLWAISSSVGQTFMYKILCGHVFSFLLDIYVGVKFLGSWVTPYLTAKLFSKLAALFFTSTSRYMKFHMKPLSPLLVVTMPKWV